MTTRELCADTGILYGEDSITIRADRTAEAQEALREAEALFQKAGMERWLRKTRKALAAMQN